MSAKRVLGFGAFVAIVLTIAWASPTRPPSSQAACMPVDTFAQAVVSRIQRLVTSSDTADASARKRLEWPSTSASSVSYVTDNAVCASGEAKYSAAFAQARSATPSGTVYVWKISNVYMVMDTAQRVGEFTAAATLNANYRVLTTFMF